MNVEPFADDVACAGPTAQKCEQIDDLIRLLVTISHRWGNTAVKYRVQWGANALWADKEKTEIERLKKRLTNVRLKLVEARAVAAERTSDETHS